MTLEHATFFFCRKVVVLKVAAVKKSRRMTKDRWATLAGEFLRDVVVGGLAFVVDLGALVLAQELLFGNFALGVYWATALGFVVGLTVSPIRLYAGERPWQGSDGERIPRLRPHRAAGPMVD